jgi:hypothetical protein
MEYLCIDTRFDRYAFGETLEKSLVELEATYNYSHSIEDISELEFYKVEKLKVNINFEITEDEDNSN